MKTTAISFSYNGHHVKSDRNIDAFDHLEMLLAAIDNANPNGEFDVIVSAIGFDPWAMTSEAERMLAWQVYRRARVVTSIQQSESHQRGAMWAIRMATEAAAAIGAKFMIHAAEDVLLHPGTVERMRFELTNADYVGCYWGDDHSLNTQVFGCRVSAFADLKRRQFVVDPIAMDGICEHHMWKRVCERNLRFKIFDDWNWAKNERYFHSHDPVEFMAECERRGIVFSWRHDARFSNE